MFTSSLCIISLTTIIAFSTTSATMHYLFKFFIKFNLSMFGCLSECHPRGALRLLYYPLNLLCFILRLNNIIFHYVKLRSLFYCNSRRILALVLGLLSLWLWNIFKLNTIIVANNWMVFVLLTGIIVISIVKAKIHYRFELK